MMFAGRCAAQSPADAGRLVVNVDHPGIRISPSLYGLMTEEINHAYDGGLYAELIQNRSFKDNPGTPVHWSVVTGGDASGSIALDPADPVNQVALNTSLRLNIDRTAPGQRVGIANDGFWGIPVRPRTRYRASFYARSAGISGPLTVDLESADGARTFARSQVPHIGAAWQKYTVSLTTGNTGPSVQNRFVISASQPGKIWFSLVSLFPPTWNNRPNGNRVDLMQKLGVMKPAFLRFPGGNYLEGTTIAERFNWKASIGDLSQRPGHRGPWGYRSSDGMGLLEFLEWCEDLHMQPLLAVFAGYALDGEHVTAGPGLKPFVDDALDEIEYVTGGAHTRWGAERARDGHPAPFPLSYVEIGNEDSFDRSGSYDSRFGQFYDAIKARYPRLKIIATARVTSRTPDVIDDHYYRSAVQMENDVHHYDNYSRTGPRIFVGEWATTEGAPTPTMDAALGDAAWMTGLERNSDLVNIASYAPLLVNVNPGASQWGTNLIGYDALNSFGSPSYYAQQLFREYRGDTELPVTITTTHAAPPPAPLPHGGIGVGTWLTQSEFKDIKVTNGDTVLYQADFAQGDAGWKEGRGEWKVQDGALEQLSDQDNCIATTGDPAWTDYTYTLKARKLGGREGFLVLFHVRDSNDLVWWNVGGWGNTQTALERTAGGAKQIIGRPVQGSVETGRWYDIRIEVRGRRIRCYLDDRLVSQALDGPPAPPEPLYACASREDRTGDVLLKVVNVSSSSEPLDVDLSGMKHAVGATGEVLSGDPAAQNTITAPSTVIPHAISIPGNRPGFRFSFPAHSVTVLRVKERSAR